MNVTTVVNDGKKNCLNSPMTTTPPKLPESEKVILAHSKKSIKPLWKRNYSLASYVFGIRYRLNKLSISGWKLSHLNPSIIVKI